MWSGGVGSAGLWSLKATLLTWTSKNILVPFNEVEQRALGHHLDAQAKSQVTYSRNYFVKLYGKVLSVIRSIQNNQFDPDMNAAASVAAIAGALVDSSQAGASMAPEQDPRSESESSSSASAVTSAESSVDEVSERPVFRGVDATECVVHKISGITHRRRSEDVLACGRAVTKNFRPLRGRDIRGQPSCCIQCFKSLPGDS